MVFCTTNWGYTHFLCGCIFKGCGNWRIRGFIQFFIRIKMYDNNLMFGYIYCWVTSVVIMIWACGTVNKEITTTICGWIFGECKLNREFAHVASTQQNRAKKRNEKQLSKYKGKDTVTRLLLFIRHVCPFFQLDKPVFLSYWSTYRALRQWILICFTICPIFYHFM